MHTQLPTCVRSRLGAVTLADKPDTHYSLALLRMVRELIRNYQQRDGDVLLSQEVMNEALLTSLDDKAVIYLTFKPVVGVNKPQWHLVTHAADGQIRRPQPVLPTIARKPPSHAQSVVSHAILVRLELVCLCADERPSQTHNDPDKPTVGSARCVLSHGSTRELFQNCFDLTWMQRARRGCTWSSCCCTWTLSRHYGASQMDRRTSDWCSFLIECVCRTIRVWD